MKKLFGLFLLALVYFFPVDVQAAARFAVCATTCTWDNTSTAMWSTTSGGATGASAPVAGDTVTFDAATCVGGTTCTTTTFAGTISFTSLTFGACTASTTGCIIDAATNDTNFTISGDVSGTGTGTRTLHMGDGTWSLTGNASAWTFTTPTNLTFNANGSTIAYSASTSGQRFLGGGLTYNTVTVAGGASSSFAVSQANTIATLTIGGSGRVSFPNSATNTITTLTNVVGSSSAGVLFIVDDARLGVATISSANNWTCDFCGFQGMTFSGGGTFAGTNSFNFGRNTGITITAPSGGGGGRIIGG